MLFLSSLLSIIYNAIIISMANSLSSTKKNSNSVKYSVTVIVSAHNEENNISHLIDLLTSQTYPKSFYEIIIVNDRSTDNTHEIIKNKTNNILKYINIENTPIDWSPKKWALNQAINNAKGDIIIQTDADCKMGSKWVETIVDNFNLGNIGFVCGMAPHVSSNSFINDISIIDSIAQDAFAAGCIQLNFPITCNGRNMAFMKKAFIEVDGYNNISHILSGDDDLLLHKIANLTNYRTVFSLNQNSVVESNSPSSIIEFIRQRARWASKSLLYYSLDSSFELKLLLPFLYIVNICCVITIFQFINDPKIFLLLPWFFKTTADLFIIKKFISHFNYKFSIINFFIMSLLHPIYICIFGIIGPLSNRLSIQKWKE